MIWMEEEGYLNDTLRNNNCELGLLSMSSGDFGPAINLIDLVMALPYGPRSLRLLRPPAPSAMWPLTAAPAMVLPSPALLPGRAQRPPLSPPGTQPLLPACLQQQASSRKWTKAHCRRLPCPIFFTSSKVNTQIPRKKPPVHQTWIHSHSSCLPIKFVFRP